MDSNDKDAIIEHQQKIIERQQKEIAELKAEIEELKRLLGLNSSNSSKPPSSDSPSTPKKPAKKRRKKPGAKKGHKAHLKALLPKESVTTSLKLEPEICPDCNNKNFIETDQEPIINQFFDIPPIKPEVLEYVRPIRKCTNCETLAYAELPKNRTGSCFGSGVLAMIAVCTGVLNISKRKAMLVLNEIFNVPISLGGVSNCEAQITKALEVPYNEVREYVEKQNVAHADETGWRLNNQLKGWLWTLCCTNAAFFMVHAKRTTEAAKELIGSFCGKLITDRWNSYNFFQGIRQICWAHLLRDFRAIGEAKGDLGKIGNRLEDLALKILKLRARVRDGTLQFITFQQRMKPLMLEVEELLGKGATHKGKLGGKCRRIRKHYKNLWTFVKDEKVCPTNNHAEQMVRQGVLWRKSSFGNQSKRGAKYVERVLTASATCRLRKRSVIEFFRQACHNHKQNIEAPSLIY